MDGVIQDTTQTPLKTVTKETKKKDLSAIYEAVEDNVQQAVDRGVADNTFSSKLDSVTKSQNIEQKTVGCLMEMTIFTAPITKLYKKHAEIATMNVAKFYDPITIVGRAAKQQPHHRF